MPAGMLTPYAASTPLLRAKIPSTRTSLWTACVGSWAGTAVGAKTARASANTATLPAPLARTAAPERDGVIDDRGDGDDSNSDNQDVGELRQHDYRNEGNQLHHGDDLA